MSAIAIRALAATVLLIATTTGCASTPGKADPSTISFIQADPAQKLACDTRILLGKIELDEAAGKHWQGVSNTQRTLASDALRERFTQSLGEPQTGLSELQLSLTLQDVKLSKPVLSSAAHLLPIGLVLNAGRSLLDSPAPGNMGSVVIAGELRDPVSDRLFASFLTEQTPDAMNVPAVVSQDAAIKAAIGEAASRFGTALAGLRQCTPPAVATR